MKKVIIVLTITVALLSCSKDEGETYKLSRETIKGTWYLKEYIKEDGTVVPDVSACSTQRNEVIYNFPSPLDMRTINYYSDCTNQVAAGNYTIDQQGTLLHSGTPFPETCEVTLFTKNEMHLRYQEIDPATNGDLVYETLVLVRE